MHRTLFDWPDGVPAAGLTTTASAALRLVIRDPEGVVAPGTLLTATSSNASFKAATGTVDCENTLVPATLSNNGEVIDKSIASEALSFGDYEGITGACATSAAGPTDVTWSGFNWTIEYRASGKVTITGSLKKVLATITFLAVEPPHNTMTWEADKKLAATIVVGSTGHPAPLELAMHEQGFRIPKKICGIECIYPRELTLSGSWTLTDADGALSAESVR